MAGKYFDEWQIGETITHEIRRTVIAMVEFFDRYATAYAARWWKINYVFSSAVTDRSTWSVRIIGDPVHISN